MLHLVLYQPQIPPNTGNIGRLCVATGSKLHLIHPMGFQVDGASVRRAGLDYWEHLALAEYENWQVFCETHPRGRFHYYSKFATAPYTQVPYQKGDFLVFGSETQGLPQEFHQIYANEMWGIPMWGPTRSLNLATSVGIVTYEALRQITQNFTNLPGPAADLAGPPT